ncbi:MAG TPA: glycosyltransferase family 2 protein [Alphaproteobacteria bacterium]|nr:glycosyltransferase family 2 protein [Alphaproteobacteria bacterium]
MESNTLTPKQTRQVTYAPSAVIYSGVEAEGISVVLPAFNEEEGITGTLDTLHRHLQHSGLTYEVIIVNDGSTDGTGEMLRARRDIRLIAHDRNRGYGAALKTGIRHAKYPLIVITDADGTYPNDRIPHLVSLAAEADMVVGARIGQNVDYPFIRRVPKWFLVRFAEWVARRRIPDLNSGLRVLRKDVVERFLNILPDTFSFTTTITLAMLTKHYIVHYEPVDYYQRLGKSKIRAVRDTLQFVQLIIRTGIYFAPLRVFLPVAMGFFLGFLITLSHDIFFDKNLTDKTLILLVASTQLGMFALLADMLDKRVD